MEPGGRLTVAIEGGVRLQVEPELRYEAWALAIGGCLVVCPPGGGLATWT